MTRFSVPISDILGSAYYRIELTASSYNVTIDGTVTLTCTVKNIFGQAVSGYEVQLYKNGTSLGSSYNGITNSNGTISWSYQCTSWGINDFSVKDMHCQIEVTGYKLSGQHASSKIKIYHDNENVYMTMQGEFTNLTQNTTVKIVDINSNLAPKETVTVPFHPTSKTTFFSIGSDATVNVHNGASTTSLTARASVVYPLKSRLP